MIPTKTYPDHLALSYFKGNIEKSNWRRSLLLLRDAVWNTTMATTTKLAVAIKLGATTRGSITTRMATTVRRDANIRLANTTSAANSETTFAESL